DCGMTGEAARTVAETFHLGEMTESGRAISPQFPLSFLTQLSVNFIAMFGICFLCHGELARLKPATRHLTSYYLMMSAGGALGGLAVSVVATHVFNTVFEWSLCTFIAAAVSCGFLLYALVNRSLDSEPYSVEAGAPVSGSLAVDHGNGRVV